MAEGIISRLSRKYTTEVIAPFQRLSQLNLYPSEIIGDRDVTKWGIKVMKEGAEPTVSEAGTDWVAAEDKFDMDDFSLVPYKFEKRVTMNRSEMTFFEKQNALPTGMDNIWSNFAKASNYRLWRGAKGSDQFKRTQYNYITAQNASSEDYSNPSLISNASSAGDWVDDAGAAQKEIALCVGGLGHYGFNKYTSIAFYPEVVSEYMSMPIVTGSSIFGDISLLDYVMSQGVYGAVAIKDDNIYTAAGANPTKDAWDFYCVDYSALKIGYITPEDVNITPAKAETNYNVWIDNELSFAPAFVPKKYDGDDYIYKGVSRLTAIDMSD